MKIVHTIKDLQVELTALRAQGKTVEWVLYTQDMHLW